MVEAVRQLDYGRPSDRTVDGMLRQRRGTCSTKHLFLAEEIQRRFPEADPQIIHRVYCLDAERARELFGSEVAAFVPQGGVVDVHRYLTAMVAGERITIDATFPGEPWDGRSPLPLACGPGEDFPAGLDPDIEKKALEREHCDPSIREPFIAALSGRRHQAPLGAARRRHTSLAAILERHGEERFGPEEFDRHFGSLPTDDKS
jgi:hypothetical protein